MIERRDFLKTAAAAAAAGALSPSRLLGAHSAGASFPEVVGKTGFPSPSFPLGQELRLGNGEAPALQFQAWPGGTGALYEKLWREYGPALFERTTTEIEPWVGPIPSDEAEIAFLPVHRLAALLKERRISSVELTEIYLARLHRYDPELLFAVSILDDRARAEAEEADREIRAGRWKGPLHGIPYGVKDLFAVRGTRTAWGSAAFQDQVIDLDSEIVVRLRNAGAVLLAKLATGEFAQGDLWYRGRTLNPWNPEEGASGSSAGPGSATAAGCVAFAIGTETQGSIISPARRNGVTALRPTFGRVSRHGGMVLAWSMDKPGPMCRSAEDCALVFETIHGADEKDPSTLTTPFHFRRNRGLSDLRIGYQDDAPEAFLSQLRSMGALLEPMPELPSGGSNALGVESAAAFDFHVAPEGEPLPVPEGLEPDEMRRRTRFLNGRNATGVEYIQGQRRRHLLMHAMQEAIEGFDLFISGSGAIGLTNQTGHPSVVLPYEFGPRNPDADRPSIMPLTTMLIGPLFSDDTLLSVADTFQRATDWHTRRPALS